MDMSSRRVSFARLEGVVGIRDIVEWGSGRLCRYHQISCGFVSHGFDARGCLRFVLYNSRLRGGCRFRLRLDRLPGGGHFWLLGRLRDPLTIGIWGRSGGLYYTPPDDVVPPFAHVHLLSRGPGPLGFRGGRVACDGALSPTLGRLPCKSRLRLIPLNIAPVIRRLVAPAATTLRLFPWGQASNEELGAPHATHRGEYPQLRCVCPKPLQRLDCSRPFSATYYSTVIRKPHCSVSDRTHDTTGPQATDTIK